MKPVFNTLGEDISRQVTEAAALAGVDKYELLALLYAESGLDPHAERWGRYSNRAWDAIVAGDRDDLVWVINQTWPDISFGYSQRIVLYHELGDRSPSVENCLQVRSEVFANPVADMYAAAYRFASCFQHPSCDGSALSAMVVYNAGSDRRSDPDWNRMWSSNVVNYAAALDWAEQYRDDEQLAELPTAAAVQSCPTVIAGLDLMWARLSAIQEYTESQFVKDWAEEAKQDGIVQVKRALGIQE